MNQLKIGIKGMSCGGCVKKIEGNVGKLEGVNTVKVNLLEKNAEISFDENQINQDSIMDHVKDLGYEVSQL